MKFLDINGREHTFEINNKFTLKETEDSKSSPQYKLGRILAKIYGGNKILEDFPLPGCGNLSWDFWVPTQQIAFEFHGRQHFEYVKFFHETKLGFAKQQKADKTKAAIAELNNVTLIILSDEDVKEWTEDEIKEIIIRKLSK